MLEVLTGLFDTTGFVARKACGSGWTPTLVWLHVTSDLFIWLAYLSIPLALLYFTRRRDLPFPRLFILFALFILACGFTHLIDALIFEYPVYPLLGVMKFVTAVVSWATVIALVPVVPRVVNAVSLARESSAETRQRRALPADLAAATRPRRTRGYVVAVAAGVLAVLVRTAVDPLVGTDNVYVIALLAVVYVSWQHGFGPAVLCLCLCLAAACYAHFFVSPRRSLLIEEFGEQLGIALFFFCGVACAALGDAQRLAQRRAKVALATAVARGAELEDEIARRRLVEGALREREADLAAGEERYRRTIDELAIPLILYAEDGEILHVNKAWTEITGYARADIPTIPEWTRRAYGAKSAIADAHIETLYAADGRVDNGQWEITTAAGARRLWHFTTSPVGREPGGRRLVVSSAIDVTESERAADELRESEGRFRGMADGAPALIWLSEPDGRRTYFNRTWTAFTGRPADEQYGEGWADSINPDDRDRYLTAYRAALAERRPFELEYRLRRHDGADRWVLARGTPRFTPAGGFAGFVGLCLDVTERREAADSVRASDVFRRSVFENSPDCLKILDLDGRVLEMNEGGCRMMEIDDFCTVRDATWSDLWPAVNRPSIREAIADARAGRVSRFQGFCPTARGTPKFWDVSVAAVPAADGTPFRLLAVSRDVTEHRRAEERLRESEELFRQLAESIPQLAWMTDPDGFIFWYNQRWYDYTGTTFEQMKGWGWEAVHDPGELARMLPKWKAALAAGEPWEDTFPLRGADGVYRWHLSRALPMRDATGAVVRWFGTNTDITAQREMEQTLETAVRDRTAELTAEVEERKAAEEQVRSVAAELERSNGELEKFAYVASHDLQEPLRKIQAFGDRLKTKCRDALPDAGKEYVDRMLGAAGRMRRLIDDLLTFSRVATQKRPLKRVELGKLVREVVSDLDIRITQASGIVRVGPLPAIDADPTQMRQLFQNLIANAVKFQRPGVPPVVEVEGEAVELEDVPSVRLTVRDNGIGFDEKYRERIFDVFQRLHGRGEYEGTGVGLAICRKIAERHGGAITAHSKEGEGTAFVVTLPVRQSTPHEGTADDGQQPQADHHPDRR